MILKTRWKHGEKLQAKPLRSFVIDDRRRRRRSEGAILIDAFKLLSRFFHEKKKKKGRIFIHKCGFGRGSLVEDDSMNVDDATR